MSLNIGYPPKVYDLDIDSGSDLTWVQCDAPCKACTKVKFSTSIASNIKTKNLMFADQKQSNSFRILVGSMQPYKIGL